MASCELDIFILSARHVKLSCQFNGGCLSLWLMDFKFTSDLSRCCCHDYTTIAIGSYIVIDIDLVMNMIRNATEHLHGADEYYSPQWTLTAQQTLWTNMDVAHSMWLCVYRIVILWQLRRNPSCISCIMWRRWRCKKRRPHRFRYPTMPLIRTPQPRCWDHRRHHARRKTRNSPTPCARCATTTSWRSTGRSTDFYVCSRGATIVKRSGVNWRWDPTRITTGDSERWRSQVWQPASRAAWTYRCVSSTRWCWLTRTRLVAQHRTPPPLIRRRIRRRWVIYVCDVDKCII